MIPTLHRRDAVAFAELGDLRPRARRTALVRVALALALAATLAGLVLVSRGAGSGRAAVLPDGAHTAVVTLDMSASISGPIYARVATMLRGIVAANQAIGLVMFSDTAYELLPPGSPPAALAQFIRYFVPLRSYAGTPVFEQSPWDDFTAGTRISAGLATAARALRKARVRDGAIVLVSDLDDAPTDQGALDAVALQLRNDRIPVRIVPLFPSAQDRAYFASLFGTGAFVAPSAFTHTATRRLVPVAGTVPWALLALGVVLVVLLAANERLNGRLAFRRIAPA